MSASYQVMAALSFLCPLYIILVAAWRGHLSRYLFFYFFLIQFIALDAVRWMTLAHFGYTSQEYAFVYRSATLATEAFIFLMVVWLSGLILKPYPSLRLSAAIVMLVTFLITAIWLVSHAVGQPKPIVALYKAAVWRLHLLDVLFLTALNLLVLIFKLRIGLNVRGMLAGLTLHLVGLCLIEAFRRAGWHIPFAYLAPASYFLMLAIFIPTLSRYQPGDDSYEDRFIKQKIDAPLFPILVRAGIWNRYTHERFFKLPVHVVKSQRKIEDLSDRNLD